MDGSVQGTISIVHTWNVTMIDDDYFKTQAVGGGVTQSIIWLPMMIYVIHEIDIVSCN